ncbi:ankyrin repeat domain-containing protein [Gammaproteobacteria bacterium]|nr:ankyrin repeat domain-containing protein [Gammaproteobacteria bacterium]
MAENSRSCTLAVSLHADVAGSESLLQHNEQLTQERTPTFRNRFGAVTILFALTVGGMVWWQPWKPSFHPASIERMAAALQVKTVIAVPSFVNKNRDAARQHFSEGVGEDQIVSAGAEANDRDQGFWSGWTALHRAANTGQTDVAELLIANGADVDAKTAGFLYTPLFWAVRRGHRAMAELLINMGANVNATDARASTPLHFAAMQGDIGIVRLLLENSAVVYVKTLSGDYPGETPLHTTAFAGHEEIAELLLAHGADVNATDQYIYTPLRRTVDQGHLTLAELLIEHGADITTTDGSGVTLLHVVARKGHIAIAEMLITRGLDINAMDSSGFTPLDYAQGGEARMIETFERQGAICTIC